MLVTIYALQKIEGYDANDCGLNNFNTQHCGSLFKYYK